MTVKSINLFISHSWKYDNIYDRLVDMLKDKPYFEYKNYSVPKCDPITGACNDKQLREAIKIQIQESSVVLILAGVYATYSKWINIEIEIAKSLGKPILAIEYYGAEKTSTVVKNKADKVVKWNTNTIVTAIRELYNGR